MARTPIWKDIQATLGQDISDGQYRPGDRLPTEAELSTRFGVNRHTVRQALAALAAAGVVRSRRGAGVFVTARPTDYPLGRKTRFHQSVTAKGKAPARRLTRLETRAADAREAAALQLPADAAVHVVEGISLIDGQPAAFSRWVFDAARLPGFLAEMATRHSITDALAACGIADYSRASTRLTAKLARPALATLLEIQEGAPLLRSEFVNIDTEGRPTEYGRSWFVGDRVTLTLDDQD